MRGSRPPFLRSGAMLVAALASAVLLAVLPFRTDVVRSCYRAWFETNFALGDLVGHMRQHVTIPEAPTTKVADRLLLYGKWPEDKLDKKTGQVFDGWGNPIWMYPDPEVRTRSQFVSLGSNGRYDGGQADDLVVTFDVYQELVRWPQLPWAARLTETQWPWLAAPILAAGPVVWLLSIGPGLRFLLLSIPAGISAMISLCLIAPLLFPRLQPFAAAWPHEFAPVLSPANVALRNNQIELQFGSYGHIANCEPIRSPGRTCGLRLQGAPPPPAVNIPILQVRVFRGSFRGEQCGFSEHTRILAPLWVAAAVFAIPPLVFAPTLMRKRRRSRLVARGHCGACGYDLRGLPEPRCPECGMGCQVQGRRGRCPTMVS